MYTLEEFNADFPDERTCLEYLRKMKFPDGCPKCGKKLYPVYRSRQYVCGGIGNDAHQISLITDTIFRKSKTPLTYWFYAIYLVVEYGDKVTAKQLERQFNVTYKTAWRMLSLIRDTLEPERKANIIQNVGIYPTITGKYRSRTKVGGKTINLGTYDTCEEAQAAYTNAKKILRTKQRYSAKKGTAHA